MSDGKPNITYHTATEAGWVRDTSYDGHGVCWETPDGRRVIYPPGPEPVIAVLHMPAFVPADEVTIEVEAGVEPLVRR